MALLNQKLSLLLIFIGILFYHADPVEGNPIRVVVNGIVRYVTRNQALQAAKQQNNIPRSQQPVQTIKVPDKNTGQPLRQYDYVNNEGKKISIRQDLPRDYGHPQGHGNQGPHFNAGPTGEKLRQHYSWERPIKIGQQGK